MINYSKPNIGSRFTNTKKEDNETFNMRKKNYPKGTISMSYDRFP